MIEANPRLKPKYLFFIFVALLSILGDMAGNYYFAIVGDKDNPIFEMEISPPSKEMKVHLSCISIVLYLYLQ